MSANDFVNIIMELNEELYSIRPELIIEDVQGYDYLTNGYVDIVNFNGWTIYNSEINTSTEVDDAGGLKKFIKIETEKYIKKLNMII